MTDISSIRRSLITFRNANAGNPTLNHRASTMICQLEHMQAPADAAHERRLRKALALITSEIDRAKRGEDPGAPQPRADGGAAL